MKILILITLLINFSAYAFPIPKNNEANFDIIRKNKVIGNIKTLFKEEDGYHTVNTIVNIEVKILFIPAYKFYSDSKETWKVNEFIKINGYTDFEDEREYFIKGEDINESFIASGMDGEIILEKNILPLNYWNKKILLEKKIFDTQKGILREIKVSRLKDEVLELNGIKVSAEKYTLEASSNPKDKGPFPQYTLWYAKNDELLKFQFVNWKDKKLVITQRSDWNLDN
jgi:hypothetical protein